MFKYIFIPAKGWRNLFNIYGAIIDLLPLSKAVKDLSACYFSTICSTQVSHHVSFLHFRGRTFVRISKQRITSSNDGACLDVWDLAISPHFSSDFLSMERSRECTVGSLCSEAWS